MKHLSIETFREYYDEWKESQLSVSDYCRSTGFSESKFYFWKKRLESPAPSASGKFIPIQMGQTIGNKRAMFKVQRHAADGLGADAKELCEIVYHNGVVLRLKTDISLEMLKALVNLDA